MAIVVFATIFFGCDTKDEKKPQQQIANSVSKISKEDIQKELKSAQSIAYLEAYIVDVILNGSNANLGFPAGAMEGGYAYKSDAKNIARYVVTLAGKKSSNDVKADKAALFYTSNCGGCHGDNGKGLNGAFPDLTLQTLPGLQLKIENLQKQLID